MEAEVEQTKKQIYTVLIRLNNYEIMPKNIYCN